jgi:glycerol 3-phosphatase-2
LIVLVDPYDAVLLDLDGVVYRGDEPMPGAATTVQTLRSLGKAVSFVTNNSSRTPEQVAAHLRSVGVDAHVAEVVTSAMVTADLLVARRVTRAFVIGEEGLRRALAEAGISIVDGEGAGAEVVVVGLDRMADYERLRVASILVQEGAALVGSNADASFPVSDGRNWPGAGALLAAIEVTTGVEAEVVGKPAAPLLRAALERAGGGRPLMVGDRLDTDVAGAAALGWDSALVLTGVTGRAEAAASATPTFVVSALTDLIT